MQQIHLGPNKDWESSAWGFWNEWLGRFFRGEPLDWELQRLVALIPDSDWDLGEMHVARLIAEIQARHDLARGIEEVEKEIGRASVDRLGIGGNYPPEAIDDAPVAQEFVVIWDATQQLKSEAKAEEPDGSRVRSAIDVLAAALKEGLGYCASKADLMVDTAIKWAIPAAGTGYLALNPDALERVIAAAEAFLKVFFP